MRLKSLVFFMVIFCISAGLTWAQPFSPPALNKSITDVYQMDVAVATNNISPETTSMLLHNA